ncbi:glutamine synthetase family protein [Kitasatospora sp. NPDC098652]|uniref:glutamine synthetase family protein n=1 Tax=Kitasatospora sp. NPDC098652 TaxID=3364095 RepID=UPI0037FB30CA
MRTARPLTGPSLPSPRGPLSELVASRSLDTVLLATVDPQGRLKGKEHDARTLLRRLESGPVTPEMCGYVLGTDLGMAPLPAGEFSWESGFGDIAVLPDLDHARVIPWEPNSALVLARPLEGGRPHPLSPATVLDEQLARLQDLGFEARVGIETEFLLYEGTVSEAAAAGWRGLRPVTWDNRDYALDRPGPAADFSRSLRQALAGAALPVEALKFESAPGQVEVTFPYGPAPAACEQHVLFKHAARAVAEQHRLAATFMAAPSDGVGSGMHLHLSLWKGDQPVTASEQDAGALSQAGGQAVAGLLEALPEMGPLWAPYVNSHKRLGGPFAPSKLVWGRDNRSCAVRVVGHGPSLHLEVRLPGADANPYLALAAAFASIRHGITGKLAPDMPVTGDAQWAGDARVLSRHPWATVERFEASRTARELLGERVVDHLVSLAWLEVEHHAGRVTDAELARGFAQA